MLTKIIVFNTVMLLLYSMNHQVIVNQFPMINDLELINYERTATNNDIEF
jgi:hypothetical protein